MTGPSLTASFVYDGDGARVKSTINGVTTYFVGSHYEVTGSTVTKYYFAGSTRVAMRTGSTVSYLLSDHLGSTSLTTNASGTLISELRYKPWGETRYSNGTTPTKYTYTGQYSNVSDFGLYFYNARWYDPALGRFAQADSIVPGGVQGYDRYAYANNNALRYTDPTGHCPWCIAVGVGAVVGAAVGYGTQVYDNYQHGVTDPLTTNISAEPIVNGAFIGAGAVLGVGLIATAPIFAAPAVAAGAACADGDCTNEAVATKEVASQLGDDIIQLPARAIRFTQDTISPNTKAGVSLDTLTDEISNGFFKGYIRVTQYGGNIWSLDNRRLAAFKLLDVNVPVKMVKFSEVATEFAKKFTTITDGLSIIVKGTHLIIK